MMHNATTLAQYMTTATDRLAAAYTLRSRAYQWAAATSDTADLLAAMEYATWSDHLHRAECAPVATPS